MSRVLLETIGLAKRFAVGKRGGPRKGPALLHAVDDVNLRAVLQRKVDHAQLLLKAHIEQSKAEVRKITLHMLLEARTGAQ